MANGAMKKAMPGWLTALLGILGPVAKSIAVALAAAWTKGGVIGAACAGLAKLLRHVGSRCDELANDPRTDPIADGWLRIAQQHADEAAWALLQAQAAHEAKGTQLSKRVADALETFAKRRGVDLKQLVNLLGSERGFLGMLGSGAGTVNLPAGASGAGQQPAMSVEPIE